jgi:hypothetical protein
MVLLGALFKIESFIFLYSIFLKSFMFGLTFLSTTNASAPPSVYHKREQIGRGQEQIGRGQCQSGPKGSRSKGMQQV